MSQDPVGEPLFERVALIGVGLIGASLAQALRRDGLAGRIDGCVRSKASRAYCLEHDSAGAFSQRYQMSRIFRIHNSPVINPT